MADKDKVVDVDVTIKALQENNEALEKRIADLEKVVQNNGKDIQAHTKSIETLEKVEIPEAFDSTSITDRIDTIEETVNSIDEVSKEVLEDVDKVKKHLFKVQPKENKGPDDRTFTIDEKSYKLKFPKAKDAKGIVDFRDLTEDEVIAMFERFPNNFIEQK